MVSYGTAFEATPPIYQDLPISYSIPRLDGGTENRERSGRSLKNGGV